MKKDNDENKSTETTTDIHGRIEAMDQSLRSVSNRLRAVEKRLSLKKSELEPDADLIIIDDEEKNEINPEMESRIAATQSDFIKLQVKLIEIEQKLVNIEKITNDAHITEIRSIETQLSDAEHRITKLENLNKITVGKIKVPIELSGLVAAIVLLSTGYLISLNHWDMIRSSYYPIIIGILFGIVVIVKFIMTNRK